MLHLGLGLHAPDHAFADARLVIFSVGHSQILKMSFIKSFFFPQVAEVSRAGQHVGRMYRGEGVKDRAPLVLGTWCQAIVSTIDGGSPQIPTR